MFAECIFSPVIANGEMIRTRAPLGSVFSRKALSTSVRSLSGILPCISILFMPWSSRAYSTTLEDVLPPHDIQYSPP